MRWANDLKAIRMIRRFFFFFERSSIVCGEISVAFSICIDWKTSSMARNDASIVARISFSSIPLKCTLHNSKINTIALRCKTVQCERTSRVNRRRRRGEKPNQADLSICRHCNAAKKINISICKRSSPYVVILMEIESVFSLLASRKYWSNFYGDIFLALKLDGSDFAWFWLQTNNSNDAVAELSPWLIIQIELGHRKIFTRITRCSTTAE